MLLHLVFFDTVFYWSFIEPSSWSVLIWIRVGQGPTAHAVDAGGGLFGHFSLVYHFSFRSPCLWETAGYRLKYCLRGTLSPNQPTNVAVFQINGDRRIRQKTYPDSPSPFILQGAPVTQWVKRWPAELAVPSLTSIRGDVYLG